MEKQDSKIKNVYREFADKVRRWNGMYKIEAAIIGIAVVMGCAVVSILSMLAFADFVYWIAALFAVMYGMLFSWMHCEMYIKIDGKGNRVSQYLHDMRMMVAFSIKEYYKEIARRLKKKTMIIAAIVFGVLFLANILNLSEHFLEVIGLCFMTIGIMIISISVNFYFLRFFDVRSYYSQRNRKRKTSKNVKQTEKQFWTDYPLMLVIMVVVVMIISFALAEYRDYSLRVPNNINVYRTVTSGFLLTYLFMICTLYGGEQIGRLITRKNGSVKKVIGYGLAIVIIIVYSFTFYTTYYEDKIVTNRCLKTKEYAWSDVQSYTVKKKWLSEIIQLELEMEDCTISVISSNTFFSEKYEEVYFGDYEYIAHLVEKMDGYGIPGTLEDEEVIAPDTEINDPYEIEAFDRIKTAVYGTDEQEKINGK